MFKIDTDKTIHISRGDGFSIILKIKNDETFKVDDVLRFRVFNRKGYKETPLLEVEKIVQEEGKEQTINVGPVLFSGDINKPTTYWYEISLNETNTLIGYDEDGAKLLIVYPAEEGGVA
jgi:exopolysaccharide biosynthesis protein